MLKAQAQTVALAGKLLTAVWALLRHGVCYEDQMSVHPASFQDLLRWGDHGNESTLCASSTNRSLYVTFSQIALDSCVFFIEA